jgi:CRP-like cAMP-binding protein
MITFMEQRYTCCMERPSAAALGALPLFGGLPEDALQKLVEKLEVVHVDAGTTVFREGDVARSLYVLVQGTLEIVKAGLEGDVHLGTIHPGECFGEMSFIDMQPRSATVRAHQSADVWMWPYQAIHERYCKDQKCAMLLVMNIARELSRRLRRADELLSHTAPPSLPPSPADDVEGRNRPLSPLPPT